MPGLAAPWAAAAAEREAPPADAWLAAMLLAVDPAGLGGMRLREATGEAASQVQRALQAWLPGDAPVLRLPAGVTDDHLLGALDLAASLRAGRAVAQPGMLARADGGLLVIPMAERIAAGVAGRLAAAFDTGVAQLARDGLAAQVPARFAVLALDEGGADEAPPAILCARLAFWCAAEPGPPPGDGLPRVREARGRLAEVAAPDAALLQALAEAAAAFGIPGMAAPLLALRAARAAAALAGRARVAAEDVALAARLVLGPRALQLPETAPAETPSPDAAPDREPDQPAPPDEAPKDGTPGDGATPPESASAEGLADMVLAAITTNLPPGLLDALGSGGKAASRAVSQAGSGRLQKTVLRGRPAGVRVAVPGGGARLALLDTLRAAAPWQAARRAEAARSGAAPAGSGLMLLRRADFRVRRFVRRRESTVVFCVDASGSAALQRLAESKGAVELLLGEAYAARTQAALIAFRGPGAAVLLPPTRALARARRLLADLAGGGGTPVAAGLDAALGFALRERARGRDALVVVLTDGRANIGRDGTPGRAAANSQALQAARALAAQGVQAVLVDTASRPGEAAAALAAAMQARYVTLPYVSAGAVRDAVAETLRRGTL